MMRSLENSRPNALTAEDALDRTILLMRDYLRPDTTSERIVTALHDTSVVFVSDGSTLREEAAQHALVTAVLLTARMGVSVYLDCPNVPLIGIQSPLKGTRILDGLTDICSDLIPERNATLGWPAESPDLVVFVGNTPSRGQGRQMIRLGGGMWTGITAPPEHSLAVWPSTGSPFGPLTAAGLGATEAFKAAMRKLQASALYPPIFTELFAPVSQASVSIAPRGTPPPPRDLGSFDLVSGGAINQSALYALARIAMARGLARVIEPDHNDVTNLNRNAFLRRSRLGLSKADDLASQPLGNIVVAGVSVRFDDATKHHVLPFAPSVLVGVDHIPTRWAVQRAGPVWLGVGASSHYMSVASFHTGPIACAGCLHPVDDPNDTPIPTVSFVSHWAGLWLAAMLCRHRTSSLTLSEQSVFVSLLRPDSSAGIWKSQVPVRHDCPVGHHEGARNVA